MKDQGGGKIINISSLMSVLGRATIQPYNATKFAINVRTHAILNHNLNVELPVRVDVFEIACGLFRFRV